MKLNCKCQLGPCFTGKRKCDLHVPLILIAAFSNAESLICSLYNVGFTIEISNSHFNIVTRREG